MPKRKSKLFKKVLLCIFIGLFSFYIYYVFLRNKENKLPEGVLMEVLVLSNNLYCERYLNTRRDCQELYLTDSLNFRLFVLSYTRENKEASKVIIDSNKVIVFRVTFENHKKIYDNVAEYTFEELKTKNNLRKGK